MNKDQNEKEALELEKKKSALTDELLYSTAKNLTENGIELPMLLDRILTFGAAQAVASCGVSTSAEIFRSIAKQIEAGAFMHIDRNCEGEKY